MDVHAAEIARDAAMRRAAGRQFEARAVGGIVTAAEIAEGFAFEGEVFALCARRRGVFRPRGMRHVLSLRTVALAPRERASYPDQRDAARQVREGEDGVDYAFAVGGPTAVGNLALRDAWLAGVPVLYLLGTGPGRYALAFPSYVAEWSPERSSTRIVFGVTGAAGAVRTGVPPADERRAGLARLRARLGGGG